MDSVEYSGLRQYILSQKPRKDRVHRELWESNGATYGTYRKFLNHVKEFGFPDEKELESPSLALSARHHPSRSNPNRLQPALAFSGVEAIIDRCNSAITVMVYGSLTNSLIAFGTREGSVWILHLQEDDHQLNKLLDHDEEVGDVDWSLDNSLLLSCSITGCVCLSGVEPPSVFRKWRANTRTTCCKFHWMNQNLVIVGGGGSLYVFNCSTGAQVQRITIIPSPSTYLAALACTNSHIYLGDSTGALRTYKTGFKNNVLQLSAVGGSVAHPYSKTTASVIGINIRSYSSIFRSIAILVSYEDASFGIFKSTPTGARKIELCTKLALRPSGRRVKAVWCPATDLDHPEHIAVGGEHANVHIYNLVSSSEAPTLVNSLSAHEAPVVAVCWSFDGCGLISGDENGTIVAWRRVQRRRHLSVV